STSVTLPPTSDGFWNGTHNYTLGLVLDPFNYVSESSKANNSNTGLYRDSGSLYVSVGMADLVGTSFSVNPGSVTPGSAVNVGFGIANQGASSAGGFYAAVVLSQDSYISTASDRVLSY